MLAFLTDIFSSLFTVFLLVMAVLAFVIYAFFLRPAFKDISQKKRKRKKHSRPIQETIPPPKKEKPEERYVVKEDIKRPTLEKIENQRFREKIEEERSSIKLVGIVEPIGMWTRMVIQQKLDFLMARLGMGDTKGEGYWVNLIKAQETQKREKGRGR